MRTKRQWTIRDWKALLKENDYYFKRYGKGSHEIWSNGQDIISFQLDINCMQARRLIKEHKLQMEG